MFLFFFEFISNLLKYYFLQRRKTISMNYYKQKLLFYIYFVKNMVKINQNKYFDNHDIKFYLIDKQQFFYFNYYVFYGFIQSYFSLNFILN